MRSLWIALNRVLLLARTSHAKPRGIDDQRVELLRWLLVSLSLLLGLWLMADLKYSYDGGFGWIKQFYVVQGEVLLHNLPWHRFEDSWQPLPLSSVVSALVTDHLGPSGRRITAVALELSWMVLLAALSRQFGSWRAVGTALGIALAAGILPSRYSTEHIESYYAVTVMVCANVLAWRARSDSPWKVAALCLSVAASLLFRSPLVFFPILLVAWEAVRAKGRDPRPSRRRRVAMIVAPYIVLVPWIAYTWTWTGRFIPLEGGEGDIPVITAALGLIDPVTPVLAHSFAEAPQARMSPMRFALMVISAHPLRYLGSFLMRLQSSLLVHPFISLAAIAAFWIRRRDPRFQDLALFCAYFLGIHCLMPVRDDFIRPLWPLLAIAAGALSDRVAPRAPGGREPAGRWLVAVIGFFIVAESLLVSLTLWKVADYDVAGSRNGDACGPALDRAIADAEDPWLRSERGACRLRRRDWAGAAEDFRRSTALQPDNYEHQADWGWAMMLGTRRDGLLRTLPRNPAGLQLDSGFWTERPLYSAAAWLRRGQVDQARAELILASQRYFWPLAKTQVDSKHWRPELHDMAYRARLTRELESLADGNSRDLLAALPPDERYRLFRTWAAIPPKWRNALFELSAAEAAWEAGKDREAEDSLRLAEALSGDIRGSERATRLHQDLGR